MTVQLHSSMCFLSGRFLYSDEVQIGPETVMTTLYTAKKYAVPALEAHCVEFLKKNLRADNAFMLLTQVSFVCSSNIFIFNVYVWDLQPLMIKESCF